MPLSSIHQAAGVRYSAVRKSFGASEVLRGIDLDVPAGTTACIVGPSGSGKSTLLRCANLMERPDSGCVHLGEQEITAPGVDIDAVRARVGMVFQHFHLYAHLDVLGNVSLALRKVRALPREQAEALALEHLRSVGLQGLERRRPCDLSGGQQQRVAIARSLAMQPQVMLFDEATSALDPELVKGVLGLMHELSSQGMTMLVVTHEMRFAREAADQIVFVDQGQVLEAAAPDMFFDAPRHPRLRVFLDQIL
jgi:ABC-type polar amino acid transport system ATPase subunit